MHGGVFAGLGNIPDFYTEGCRDGTHFADTVAGVLAVNADTDASPSAYKPSSHLRPLATST